MPLLDPSEYTVEALMADLPMQRSARNQLQMQLTTLQEGLALQFNPLEQNRANKQHIVAESETLQIIAIRLYGNINRWLEIANLNGIDYPYLVYPGQILKVTDPDV